MGGNKGRRPGRTWEGFAGRAKAPTSNQKKTRKYSRNKNGKRARATFRTHMGVPRNSHPSGDKNEPVTVTEATAEGRPWQTRAGGGGIPPPVNAEKLTNTSRNKNGRKTKACPSGQNGCKTGRKYTQRGHYFDY